MGRHAQFQCAADNGFDPHLHRGQQSCGGGILCQIERSAAPREFGCRHSFLRCSSSSLSDFIGWINQSYIGEQWRWYTVTRPYMQAQVRPHVLTAAAEQALKPTDSFRECTSAQGKDYCPDMVVVPAGSFMMGRPPTEKGYTNEDPQHPVTIAQPFAVSKFELTFAEWDSLRRLWRLRPAHQRYRLWARSAAGDQRHLG